MSSRSSRRTFAQNRVAELRRCAMLEELRQEEAELKAGMNSRRKEVLRGKGLVLFDKLIKDSGHLDSALVQNLSNRFALTAVLPQAGVFHSHLRPAKILRKNFRSLPKTGSPSGKLFQARRSAVGLAAVGSKLERSQKRFLGRAHLL